MATVMWIKIIDVFEKRTLLNNLISPLRFYTATPNSNESDEVLDFSSRVRQFAGTLISIGVTIADSEIKTTLVNGASDRLDGLLSDLNALGNVENLFTFDFVIIPYQQKAQRHATID